jgi:hypothetical protein
MASAVNKTTFDVRRSINAPDFPLSTWVINSPNLDTLVGTGNDTNPQIPKRYWIVDLPTSQNLREMDATEKTAADANATNLARSRASKKIELQTDTDNFILSLYSLATQQELSNLRATVTGAQKAFLDGYFAWYQSIRAALNVTFVSVGAAATVPLIEAVFLNYAPFASSDPGVTAEGVLALASGAVVGTGVHVYDTSVSTTTSTTFQTKVEILNAVIAAGVYKFTTSYGWNLDSVSFDIEVKLQEKVGAGAYADLGEIHKQEPSENAGTFGITGSDQRFYTSRVFTRALSANTYSWRIQFRAESTIAASLWETLIRVEAIA